MSLGRKLAAGALAWSCAAAMALSLTGAARAAALVGNPAVAPPPPYEEGVVAQIQLTGEAEVEVGGDAVLLGEVVAVQTEDAALSEWLSELPVASSPPSGEGRRLTAGMLLPTLRRLAPGVDFQLAAASAGETVTVTRAAQELPSERIVEAVDRAVAEALPWRADGSLDITFYNLPEALQVPLGDVQLDVENVNRLDRSRPGPVSLTVNVLVEGERVRTLWLRGWVETTGPPGAGGAGGYAGGGGPSSEATAPAADGPPVVSRGDTVKVVAVVGELSVTTAGIAQADGRVGEEISVRNPTSGKVVTGRVTAEGAVEVRIEAGA